MRKSFFILIIAAVSSTWVLGQKTVKGLPEAFERPKDLFENPEAVKKMLLNTGDKSKKEAWIVISDRDKNPVYKEPETSSSIIRELNFRELYYVVDEKEDWVKIADAPNLNKLKSRSIVSIGWVPKSKLLLWNSGLLDYRTNINKKAFLLNRADDVKRVLERKLDFKDIIVDFYKDPNAEVKDIERTIYDYFFIFKKENRMLLLAEDSELSSYNISSKLLGWVDERKVQEWNTRICLEPNFSSVGFEERKDNHNLRLKAFGDERNVSEYVNTDREHGLFYSSDPVSESSKLLSNSDPKRYPGNQVRYPMFKKGNIDGVEFYKSGVIGSIKVFNDANNGVSFEGPNIHPSYYAKLKEKAIELNYRSKNVNIFFVIEGTDKTYAHKQSITQAIKSLRINKELRKMTSINYGALIYKDIPEGNRLVQFERLTPDLDKVVGFVDAVDFTNQSDQDDYTAFYHGLKKSLQIAGFDKSKTNIIVLLGAAGDFSKDPARLASAKAINHEAVVEDKGSIFENLANLNAHLFSIQLVNDNLRPAQSYAFASQRLILGGAKYIYTKNSNNSILRGVLPEDLKIVNPEMDNPFGNTLVNLQGSKPGGLALPLANQSLTFNKIESELTKMIRSSVHYENGLASYFESSVLRGKNTKVDNIAKESNIDEGTMLDAGIIPILDEIMKSEGAGTDFNLGIEGTKLSLYTEVYCPVKYKNAQYNLFSFVLFMPEEDLLHYQDLINRGLSTTNSGSYPEKRKSLYNIYLALITEFAGQDILKGKKAEDFSREDVLKIMQGIQNEGLELDVDLNVRIGGILNQKEVSDAEIDALIQKFNNVNAELEKIIKLTDRFDFCMVSDNSNRYYWLRMDQVF